MSRQKVRNADNGREPGLGHGRKTREGTQRFCAGKKQYEFSNHLGNVLVMISDLPLGGLLDWEKANIDQKLFEIEEEAHSRERQSIRVQAEKRNEGIQIQ